MDIREISVDNPVYRKIWQLREDVLRKPLGLSLANDDLSAESDPELVTILAAINHEEKLAGCLLMQRANRYTVQLRQVAVAPDAQNKGVGRLLVKHAEQLAKDKAYTKIFLQSRVTAKDFYLKLGYKTTSDEYIQSTIPHVTMEKAI